MKILLAVVFEEYGLSGDEIDYYSVDNSFLDRVAENRKGAFHLPSVLDGPLHLVANIASIIFMLSFKTRNSAELEYRSLRMCTQVVVAPVSMKSINF